MITKARAVELLDYDRETGVMLWRATRQGRAKAGAVAGTERRDGYRCITIDRCTEFAHRIAWLIEHDEWPAGDVDHINGNPRDNSIANLRSVTRTVNSQNRRRPAQGAPLIGAHWSKVWRRWKSSIQVDGKPRHLGWFDTPEAAHAAYIDAKRQHHAGCTI